MSSAKATYKPLGLTPLQAINLFKEKYPEYRDQKISYAGRLDPMAEGLLMLLVGDENKNRNEYEELEKEYEFEILFGVSTDTYDVLGLITDKQSDSSDNEVSDKIIKNLSKFIGKFSQAFPPYSSKPVNGKPLYWWARNNKLVEIEIPVRNIEIKKLRTTKTYRMKVKVLEETILNKIKLVKGDFRQDEIINSWKIFFASNVRKDFCVMKFSAIVTSGTYIRSLAKRMGEEIGVPSLAYSIKRLRVGNFKLSNSIQLDK